jgi:hypothetical protein
MPDFLPRRDEELAQWVKNFDRLIYAAPGQYGLTDEQAAELHGVVEDFLRALQAATQPGTRTRVAVAGKDAARGAMKAMVRRACAVVKGQAHLTPADIVEVGLRMRKKQSKIPRPTTEPLISVMPLLGRNAVRVRLGDKDAPSRKAKPRGVDAATFFYCLEDEETGGPGAWRYGGMASRTTFDIKLPSAMRLGQRVWVRAFWINSKAQRGPDSAAAYTRVVGGALAA